jgi:hypothetical protein
VSGPPGLDAASLRQRFDVHGRYYDCELGAGHAARRLPARSHLEIFERSLSPQEAIERPADLVAVMMNPGGSRPLSPPDADGWAPALPDRTQYQLMKLALRAKALGLAWRHIRVVNLSDLRAPKSATLFATLAEIDDDRHSLFSAARRAELTRALGTRRGPLLRAWGLAPQLAPLASRAIALTDNMRVLGLTSNGDGYRHPLPQRADLQAQWLDAVGSQVAVFAACGHPA